MRDDEHLGRCIAGKDGRRAEDHGRREEQESGADQLERGGAAHAGPPAWSASAQSDTHRGSLASERSGPGGRSASLPISSQASVSVHGQSSFRACRTSLIRSVGRLKRDEIGRSSSPVDFPARVRLVRRHNRLHQAPQADRNAHGEVREWLNRAVSKLNLDRNRPTRASDIAT
jgi:hypothetical protein